MDYYLFSFPLKILLLTFFSHAAITLVGLVGLEPTTSSTRTTRASQLRYSPVVALTGIEPVLHG